MSRRCPRKSVDQTRPLRKLWAISAKPDPLQLLGLSGFSGFVIRSVTCVWLINISWIRLKCCRTEFYRKRSVFWSNVTLEYIDWWSHGFPWNCCFVLDWCYGIEMNWYENKIFLCFSENYVYFVRNRIGDSRLSDLFALLTKYYIFTIRFSCVIHRYV